MNHVGEIKICLVKEILVLLEYIEVGEREILVADDTNRIAGGYACNAVTLVAGKTQFLEVTSIYAFPLLQPNIL